MKHQQITSTHDYGKNMMQSILAIFAFFCCDTFAESHSWPRESGEITLPAGYHPGYRPSLHFVVEQDKETGFYYAQPSIQARFNQQWMNQNRDKVGDDAKKELLQLGIKALYKRLYERSETVSQYLPDEEGRVALNGSRQYKMDYTVHVRSDSLRLGWELEF